MLDGYSNMKQIGEGTYGIVYRAEHIASKEIHAIKAVKIDKVQGFPFTTIREIKMLKKLKHENIIGLKDLKMEDQTIYITMEFMPYDLSALIQQKVQFSDRVLKSMAYQLLSAAKYFHEMGYIHRDIKPSNILIGRDGTLKLADFGLMRKMDPFMTNRVCTLWYRAPEILLGSTDYDTTIDSWSIGCVILEMKMLQTPFRGSDEIDQVKVVLDKLGCPKNNYAWSYLFDTQKYCKDESFISIVKRLCGDCLEYEMRHIVTNLLRLDPIKRFTAKFALSMGYFCEYNLELFSIDREESHDFHLKENRKKLAEPKEIT